jgi:DNA (cytosine-5)-methyltransferase 1
MRSRLVLSLFPGLGLLDRAFEAEGFTIVRGPDAIWGGDARSFHVEPGIFDGVIGGPPCQKHSTASAIAGTTNVDLIPEFARVVDEAKPRWITMENVLGARHAGTIPAAWNPTILRDWDCGGLTARRRMFWTWPFLVLAPPRRAGQPSLSVMATTWKRGKSTSQYVTDKGFLPGDLPTIEYGRLQGHPEVAAALEAHRFSKASIVTLLGNGVPMAMGRHVARAARDFAEERQS